jgi:hypothetical protein
MTASESIPRYDLLVSLDLPDLTAACALFDLATGSFLPESLLELAPEALEAWWRELRADFAREGHRLARRRHEHQHVLPPGQHRIRTFGWMHPAAKRRRMLVETLLVKVIVVRPPLPPPPKWHLQCRRCGAFALVEIATIKPGGAVRFCHRATGPPRITAA